MTETITFGEDLGVDADESPRAMLISAYLMQEEAVRLKKRAETLEREAADRLRQCHEFGQTEAELEHGKVLLEIKLPVRTRVLDVTAFRKQYPAAFRKVAAYSVKLPDAEAAIGKVAVDALYTVREGEPRLKARFETTFDPLARGGRA